MRGIPKYNLLLLSFLMICPPVSGKWSDGWWSSDSSDSSESSESVLESDTSSISDATNSENIDSLIYSEFEEPIRNVF